MIIKYSIVEFLLGLRKEIVDVARSTRQKVVDELRFLICLKKLI